MNTGLGRNAAILALLVTAALVATGCPGAKIVIFADTGLDAAVRASLGKPLGLLTEAELLTVVRIDARSLGITSLHNLEFCRNLQWLDLSDNRVSDITPLATLTNLTYVNLDSNEVTDITPLAGLFNLDQVILTNSYETDHPGNQIWNLEPLVVNAENGGLGPGDSVTLDSRTLKDPDTEEIPQTVAAQIDLLIQHGVDVILTEQAN